MSSKHIRTEPNRRVAFLLPNMGGGGAERVALTLIKHFIDRGYKVDLLLMRAEGELMPLIPAPVDVIDLHAWQIRDALWRVRSYLKAVQPASIQVSMWPLTVVAIVAQLFARTSTRVVVSDHAVLSRQYEHRGFWHRQLLRWSIRLLYPRAYARVVVAKETAEDLARITGLQETAFEVVYNPVDPPVAIKPNQAVDTLWGGPGKRVLNIGRLSQQKNQTLLLEAFAKLAGDPRLVILGEGDLRAQLEQRARELGIADRVSMPGFILDPTPYYASADVFVLSSDYEGYPLVMIEAMYCGLKIVSTDCPSGPAEILDRGKFGTLTPCGDSVRLADAITSALSGPADAARIKARAVELSAHAADRYWELMTA